MLPHGNIILPPDKILVVPRVNIILPPSNNHVVPCDNIPMVPCVNTLLCDKMVGWWVPTYALLTPYVYTYTYTYTKICIVYTTRYKNSCT